MVSQKIAKVKSPPNILCHTVIYRLQSFALNIFPALRHNFCHQELFLEHQIDNSKTHVVITPFGCWTDIILKLNPSIKKFKLEISLQLPQKIWKYEGLSFNSSAFWHSFQHNMTEFTLPKDPGRCPSRSAWITTVILIWYLNSDHTICNRV